MIAKWLNRAAGGLLLGVSLFGGGGCRGSLPEAGQGAHWHPDPARLPPLEAFDWIATPQDSDSVLQAWAARLQQAHLKWEVGTWIAEDRYRMFGKIWDVVIDGTGRVVVLDFENQEVRIYDQDGRFVTLVGRQGEGPGEYIQAGHLLVGVNDTLYVYDYSRALFVVYRRQGSGYEFVRLLDLPVGASFLNDGCLHANGHLITQQTSRLREDPLFFEIDLSPTVVRSFGRHRHYATREQEGFLHSEIYRAFVACGEGVVASYLFFPIVDYFVEDQRYSFFLDGIYLQPFLLIDNRIAEYYRTDSFIEEYAYTGQVDDLIEPVLLEEDLLFYTFIRYESERGRLIKKYPMAYLLDLRRRKAMRLNLETYPFATLVAVRDSVLIRFRWDLFQQEIPHIAYYVLPAQPPRKRVS
ncbi:6-bladed beta-propeller [Rhodothermus profundi]|uniref:6-bladed beta-propeller protein n=1 Tax=Rhodothermus profundi TaxID=633813 RepID=A0A1M6VVR0_9BACT|nr:6-bladed beta-propeller [Rhodothermus profundi]SHK85531.1 hypothetical protein SAMN04488087_2132 [Rhodothermus profundi]